VTLTPAQTRLPTVALLDTAVISNNLGDQIIMEAVRSELAEILPGIMQLPIASHEYMGPRSRAHLKEADFAIAGGTNLLSSRMWFRPVWNLRFRDAITRSNVVLMGVGWYQYQHRPDPYSRWLLTRLLSRTHLHSVRESYAQTMLASIGITKVVNTGCPTIWHLTPDHCAGIPREKRSDSVVTAINSYKGLRDPEADRRMLQALRRHYKSIHLWIQTPSDFEYARSLGVDVTFVEPTLASLDGALSGREVDYVGNRLHAGIRAMQKGRRAVIVEVDNRAREMGRDFGLPTVGRTDFERLEAMMAGPLVTSIRLPVAEIARWKRQFRPKDEAAG
jgi:polysaccharide pyruvyl transferase WcaK-like protein